MTNRFDYRIESWNENRCWNEGPWWRRRRRCDFRAIRSIIDGEEELDLFKQAMDWAAPRMLNQDFLNVAFEECSHDLEISIWKGELSFIRDWNRLRAVIEAQIYALREVSFPDVIVRPILDDAKWNDVKAMAATEEGIKVRHPDILSWGRDTNAFSVAGNAVIKFSSLKWLYSEIPREQHVPGVGGLIVHEILHQLGHSHVSYADRNFMTVFQNVVANDGKYRQPVSFGLYAESCEV